MKWEASKVEVPQNYLYRAKWKIEPPSFAFTIQHRRLKSKCSVHCSRYKGEAPKCRKYHVKHVANTMCHERFYLQDVAEHAHAMQNERSISTMRIEIPGKYDANGGSRFQQSVLPQKFLRFTRCQFPQTNFQPNLPGGDRKCPRFECQGLAALLGSEPSHVHNILRGDGEPDQRPKLYMLLVGR